MLSINLSELLLTVLSFFVLMFALDRLLYRPVIRFREERQQRMDESFRRESLAKEQQAQAEEEVRQLQLDSLKQARELAEQAQEKAGEARLAAEKQMQQENQAILTQAEEESRTQRDAGGRRLEQRRHELARTLADRLSQ